MDSQAQQRQLAAACNKWKSSVEHLLRHYQHYLMEDSKKYEMKRILFYDVIKSFVENSGDLSMLESCLSRVLLNLSIHGKKNNKISFRMLNQYTCSDVIFQNLPQSMKAKYCIWNETVEKWNSLQPKTDDEIVVVFTPHMGKLDDDDNNNNNNKEFRNENDYHCRLIVSIFATNTQSVFGLYDCNGTFDHCNVSRNGISSLHSLMIGNLTIECFQKYNFLKGITHSRTCLHVMGHFLNQWIRFHTSSDDEFYQSSCYFFTIWSIVGVTIAIIWNKYKFISYLSRLKSSQNSVEKKYIKNDLVLLLSYDMQMLLISRIILDAREPVWYQVSKQQLFGLKKQRVYKGARMRRERKKNKYRKKETDIDKKKDKIPTKQTAIVLFRKWHKHKTHNFTKTKTKKF